MRRPILRSSENAEGRLERYYGRRRADLRTSTINFLLFTVCAQTFPRSGAWADCLCAPFCLSVEWDYGRAAQLTSR